MNLDTTTRTRWLVVAAAGLLALSMPAFGVRGVAAAQDTATVPSAQEVLDHYVDAIGGAKAMNAHTSRHFTGTMSLPAQGIEGTLELFSAEPNLYLLKVQIPGIGEIASGFDGTVGWVNQPMSGPMLLEGAALDQIREEAEYDELLKDPARYTEMVNEGLVDIEGHKAWKLKLVRKSGRTTREYYDAETWLPVAYEGPQETPMGTVEVRTVIGANKDFGGVIYPSEMRQKMMGMEQVMRLTAADFDKVDRSVFDLPPAIRALVEAKTKPQPQPAETPEPLKEKGGW